MAQITEQTASEQRVTIVGTRGELTALAQRVVVMAPCTGRIALARRVTIEAIPGVQIVLEQRVAAMGRHAEQTALAHCIAIDTAAGSTAWHNLLSDKSLMTSGHS